MLTRALATLTMLLALTAGADSMPTAADEVEGCREPAPTAVPVAPASCTDEGQP